MMALMYGPLVYIIMQHDGPLMMLGVAHCAHHASCTNVLLILAATTMLVEQVHYVTPQYQLQISPMYWW